MSENSASSSVFSLLSSLTNLVFDDKRPKTPIKQEAKLSKTSTPKSVKNDATKTPSKSSNSMIHSTPKKKATTYWKTPVKKAVSTLKNAINVHQEAFHSEETEEELFSPSFHVDEAEDEEDLTAYMTAEDELPQDDDMFNPFTFIRYLPDLSNFPPRKVNLPRKTRSCPPITLVLDLDETLVHCSTTPLKTYDLTFEVEFNSEHYTVYVLKRPFLQEFLEKVSTMFEVVIFTASQKVYADKLLNILDPNRKYIKHRLFRDSCLYVHGNYLKDLTVLGRDLSQTIIVDNAPQSFGFQLSNGIPIESWYGARDDTQLLSVLEFLSDIVGVTDVRPTIENAFRLKELVYGRQK
ncbi:hypothetical protein ROZALSC1DRAFT_28089 [Rozella allomycis CSF55]|uniref:FCP1 homology domain-containing protein n=1 Tax=Rozella allomycis (strain CSF55) TaxID=988480 RepID=A0A4P9YP35_ROZAC|nr:hypothetical protein ROZALSC1DRAFT_28089 [Rozella allomycis CSF55]